MGHNLHGVGLRLWRICIRENFNPCVVQEDNGEAFGKWAEVIVTLVEGGLQINGYSRKCLAKAFTEPRWNDLKARIDACDGSSSSFSQKVESHQQFNSTYMYLNFCAVTELFGFITDAIKHANRLSNRIKGPHTPPSASPRFRFGSRFGG
jgi:hypothetical protein